ncbi:MAG: hypothetical protein C0519_07480 [Hyphomicrobium sp.]|nr:hypothetical protein [Hyphomicrobium sp.]
MSNEAAIVEALTAVLDQHWPHTTPRQREKIVKAALAKQSESTLTNPAYRGLATDVDFLRGDIEAIARAEPALVAAAPSAETVLATEEALRAALKASKLTGPEKLARLRELRSADDDARLDALTALKITARQAGHDLPDVTVPDVTAPDKAPDLSDVHAVAVELAEGAGALKTKAYADSLAREVNEAHQRDRTQANLEYGKSIGRLTPQQKLTLARLHAAKKKA